MAFHLPVHGWNCINKVKKAYNGQKLFEKIFTRYYSCKIILLHFTVNNNFYSLVIHL